MAKIMDRNSDYVKYYCNRQKRHIWVLGYFGGGAIPLKDFTKVAKELSDEADVPLDSINIDDIRQSSRFKCFKFIYSDAINQTPLKDSETMTGVVNWLCD